MKNKRFIICTLVAIVLLPSLVKNVHAQTNIVATNTTMLSKTSIVREYQRDLFLVYNDEGSSKTSFSLVDISTGLCRTMNLPSLIVNDVEIVKNMAYFCGSIGTTVVAGWFDIRSVFYSGGSMSMIFVPTGLSCAAYTSSTEEILSLDKLEVIEYSTGFNHLVMVGKATCTSSSTTNTCIAEIYYDGTDYKLAYQVEHEGVFGYSDLTVINSGVVGVVGVVVTGNKRGSEGEYWTAFNNPVVNSNMFYWTLPTPTPPYPPVYTNPTYGSAGAYYGPHRDSELLIANIPGTPFFATVCQAEMCTGTSPCVEGTYLNLYHVVSGPLYRCRINDYHSPNYRELKYNPQTNSFFLLMEDCATNMHNGYYEFVLDNTMSYVTKVLFHQELGFDDYVSLDRCVLSTPRSQCVLTGYDSANNFYIWKHDYVNQYSCTKTFNVPFLSVPTDAGVCYPDYPYGVTSLAIYSYTDRIYQSVLTTICDE